jgi:hypothetical protein
MTWNGSRVCNPHSGRYERGNTVNAERAQLAVDSLEDVFTPDGDAGVIEELDRLTGEADDGTVLARLSGQHIDPNTWFDVLDLQVAEDLNPRQTHSPPIDGLGRTRAEREAASTATYNQDARSGTAASADAYAAAQDRAAANA